MYLTTLTLPLCWYKCKMASEKPGIIERDGNFDDFENNLISMENLDRTSPEMWPEKVPGVTDFINSYNSTRLPAKLPYSKEITLEDQKYMHQLANLSTSRFFSKVKELHDIAYQLGVEESKEVTRGKYLNIFSKEQEDDDE